jgi:predicted dehydrogenase/threonine dehydrogenase-like Zn-dependent dehydrogenase
MKQILVKKGKAIVQEVPAPTITDPNQILIKNIYSVISRGTELTTLEYSTENLIQKSKRRPDAVLLMINNLKTKGVQNTINKAIDQLDIVIGQQVGYSTSGIVIKTGSNIQDIKPGDLVSCAGQNIANHAEIICVPKNLVVKIPKNVKAIDASTATIGAICMQSIRRANPKIGEWVSVIGLGLLGLIVSQILKANGCKVIGIDPLKKKRDLAKKLGIDYVFDSEEKALVDACNNLANGQGVDSTIITASTKSNKPLKQAMEITRKKGKVVLLGFTGNKIPEKDFYAKEIDILKSTAYGPGRYDPEYEQKSIDYPYPYVRWTENRNMQAYLELLAENKINLQPLRSKIYKLNSAPKAFEELKENPNSILIFIEYEKEETEIESTIVLERTVANDKIKVAVIGTGWMSKEEHLPNIKKNKDLDLHMIIDRNPVNAQKTAKYFKSKKSSTNFMDAINDQDIDMVLISTKNDSHAKIIIEASKAKKQIFVEKPLAINPEELKQVEEVIKENKTPIIVGFNRRFSSYTKEIIKKTKNRKNPLVINYRVNAGYRPPSDWTQDPKIGGGRIVSDACHMIDFFNYLTNSKPKKINVSSITPHLKDYSHIDNSIITIEYEDGSICSLIYTSLGNNKLSKEYIEVFCDKKVFIIDDFKEMTILDEEKKEILKNGTDKGINEILISWSNYLKNKKKEIPIPFEESLLATKITFDIMNKLNNKST